MSKNDVVYNLTLSTTEDKTNGSIKIRQSDDDTQVFKVKLIDNSQPKDFEGLTPFFCRFPRGTTGQGLTEEVVQVFDGKSGTLEYTLSANAWQYIGRNEAYFSFRKPLENGTWDEQYSTKMFIYQVEKSIYQIKFRDSNYWWTFKELMNQFKGWIDGSKNYWENFLEASRTLIESIDGGGSVLEMIDFKFSKMLNKWFPAIKDRGDFWDESLEDIADNPRWYGALFDSKTNDQVAIQKILDKAKNKGGNKVKFPKNRKFLINDTLDISSFTEINFNGATLIPKILSENKIVFKTTHTGDIVLRNLRSIDDDGTHTFFVATGKVGDEYNDVSYVRKLLFDNVYLHNYEYCVDANYGKQFMINESRFEGVKNGVLIKNKSVEINISKSLIYGQMIPGSYGIKTLDEYGHSWHYPEGIMIDGCTLDNFDKTLDINAGFAITLVNCYVATHPTKGTAAIYFGNKGVASHNEQISISNSVIGGKGIKFKPEIAPPTKFKAIISDVIFANILGPVIDLGKYAHDITISDIRGYGNASNTSPAITGGGDNKNISIDNVSFDEHFSGGVIMNGANSTGMRIGKIDYSGTGPIFYSSTPPNFSNIPFVSGQPDPIFSAESIPNKVFKKGEVIKSSQISVGEGQRFKVKILLPIASVTGDSAVVGLNLPDEIEYPVTPQGSSYLFASLYGKQLVNLEFYLRAKKTVSLKALELKVIEGDVTVGYFGHISIERVI